MVQAVAFTLHVPEQVGWTCWGRTATRPTPAAVAPVPRRSIQGDTSGSRMLTHSSPMGTRTYRTNHDRGGPIVTGTTSLMSIVSR